MQAATPSWVVALFGPAKHRRVSASRTKFSSLHCELTGRQARGQKPQGAEASTVLFAPAGKYATYAYRKIGQLGRARNQMQDRGTLGCLTLRSTNACRTFRRTPPKRVLHPCRFWPASSMQTPLQQGESALGSAIPVCESHVLECQASRAPSASTPVDRIQSSWRSHLSGD